MRLTAILSLVSAAALFPTALASVSAAGHTLNTRLNKRQQSQLSAEVADFVGDIAQLESFTVAALGEIATLSALASLAGLTPPANEGSSQILNIGDLPFQILESPALKQSILSALSAIASNTAQMGSSVNTMVNDVTLLHDEMKAAGFNLSDVVNPNDPGSSSSS